MTTRTFGLTDQLAFAELSGDYNPLHIDPVVARRSMFGAAVVHGIHSLLWGLDVWLRDRPLPVCVSAIHAAFTRPIRLGDVVTCSPVTERSDQAQLHLLVDQSVTTKIKVNWRPSSSRDLDLFAVGFPQRQEPRVLAMRDAENASGTLPLYLNPQASARLFPHLAAAMPPLPVAQLLATTRLVGMECPGLYSLYSSLDILFRADANLTPVLTYRVTKLDTRYGVAMMDIGSPNMTGVVTAFFRPPPQDQVSYGALHDTVNRSEFAGQRALIIGGSRGLGEVTAKLLSAGGAEVRLTYHRGAADARRIVAEITSAGGHAGCLPFDVLDCASNIGGVLGPEWTPTHLYYLASPFIARGKNGVFSGSLFETFCNYYVLGFHRMLEPLICRGLKRVLYPSTAFIDELPPDMGEYATAKMAGEGLCRFLEKAHPGLIIHKPRLPRMATDQTVSFMPGGNRDPVPILLEHLRTMANDHALC